MFEILDTEIKMVEILENDFYDYDDNNKNHEVYLLINDFKDFDY
jgi:hypothetical protein